MSQAKKITVELKTEEEKKSAARSNMFRSLAGAFNFLDRAFYDYIKRGEFFKDLAVLAEELPYKVDVPEELKSPGIEDFDEHASVYIRIFDAAPGGPPCSLYEGHHAQDRQRVMAELIRFYDHFDLQLDQEQREFPDHISVELEFMHYLTFKEAGSIHYGKDSLPYRRAQQDFMERHLVAYTKKIMEKLNIMEPPQFFKSFFGFLERFISADYSFLRA